MFQVKIKTKAVTRFLKIIPIPFLYVNGGKFKVNARVKNFSSQPFQGGKLKLIVTYAMGRLPEWIIGNIGQIPVDGEIEVDFQGHETQGVLANGHALFWAELFDARNISNQLVNEKNQRLQKQELGFHVHTFHALTPGELFTLIALSFNVFIFLVDLFFNREFRLWLNNFYHWFLQSLDP
ncbi:MAG: hypothetical protein ACFFDT_33025 [Candidatus Hodarchaeota archaeon]